MKIRRTIRELPVVITGMLLFAFVVTPPAHAKGQTPMSVAEARRCLLNAQCEDDRTAAYDLARDKQFSYLINLANSSTTNTRYYIVVGISAAKTGHHNAAVTAFMSDVATSLPHSERFSDTAWYALQFLAASCDLRALQQLADGGATGDTGPLMSFQVSSEDWASSLHSFGTCHFYRSREVLVRSLGAANIDAGAAAFHSLQKLYPHVCTKMSTETTMDCFEKYFRKTALPSDAYTTSTEGLDRK